METISRQLQPAQGKGDQHLTAIQAANSRDGHNLFSGRVTAELSALRRRILRRKSGELLLKKRTNTRPNSANRHPYDPQVQRNQKVRRENAHPPPFFSIRRPPRTARSAAAAAPISPLSRGISPIQRTNDLAAGQIPARQSDWRKLERNGRDGQIRTADPSHPKRVLYQAEPRPDTRQPARNRPAWGSIL